LVDKNGGSINDTDTLYKATSYVGYGSSAYFSPTLYSLVNYYLDLTTASFTISAWIWMPFNFSSATYDYFVLFMHCESNSNDKCLQVVVGDGYLRLGFFNDDLVGSTELNPNQWYHVAFAYDRSAAKQLVYLNGNLDGSQEPSNPYTGNPN
jgi:hypothetical protein